jgi:hypothetical protein
MSDTSSSDSDDELFNSSYARIKCTSSTIGQKRKATGFNVLDEMLAQQKRAEKQQDDRERLKAMEADSSDEDDDEDGISTTARINDEEEDEMPFTFNTSQSCFGGWPKVLFKARL